MTGIRAWLTANLLQVTVTVVVTLLLALATWSGAKANGSWQQATRQEARSTTARVETVRFVYQSELSLAIGLAQARVRRDTVRSLDAPDVPEVAGEVAATDQLVAQLEMNVDQASNELAHGDAYTTADGGYDVPRRLGDVIDKEEVTDLDMSAATMRDGDGWARWTTVWAVLALAVAAAYVVLAAVRGRRRRRTDPASAPDVGLIPAPWDEPRTGRLIGALALAAWVALPVLTAEQLALSDESGRAAAESSRLISQISGSATVSQVRSGAASDLQMRGIDLSMTGLSRQYAATLDGSQGQQLLGTAEERAGARWLQVAAAMTEAPTAEDGVDPITVEWLASEPADWQRLADRQEDVQIASEHAGTYGDVVALALLMAALAATAATVARLPGGLRRSASLLAGSLLAVATAIGVVAALA
jgi:hypothetical protein